ncbi:Superkiller viralicidic activity 2-like protein 2 [Hordeum vulgare]|nr:Superkiller viralicidic activity 2-like protein 2 [Hordeum vulgare]
MASTPADGAGEPVEAKVKGKEEGEKKKAGGGVLGRMRRGIFDGREDYEKRLQYLSKEEAAMHARMRRRTQFSRRTFRNIIVLSVVAEYDFVSEVHKQPCHIVYTDYRPTRLQHYVFPAGGDGLYPVVDENGKFREDSFQKSLNVLDPASGNDKKRENGKQKKCVVSAGKTNVESDIFKMVKMIIQRQYDPVILFSFSKRECEFLAMQMAKIDLNGDIEKVNTETIFWSAMDFLSYDDKKLPQVTRIVAVVLQFHSQDGVFLFNAFHLSYNMLLNQLRYEDGDPEKLLRHSFYQFQADRALPDLENGIHNSYKGICTNVYGIHNSYNCKNVYKVLGAQPPSKSHSAILVNVEKILIVEKGVSLNDSIWFLEVKIDKELLSFLVCLVFLLYKNTME